MGKSRQTWGRQSSCLPRVFCRPGSRGGFAVPGLGRLQPWGLAATGALCPHVRSCHLAASGCMLLTWAQLTKRLDLFSCCSILGTTWYVANFASQTNCSLCLSLPTPPPLPSPSVSISISISSSHFPVVPEFRAGLCKIPSSHSHLMRIPYVF